MEVLDTSQRDDAVHFSPREVRTAMFTSKKRGEKKHLGFQNGGEKKLITVTQRFSAIAEISPTDQRKQNGGAKLGGDFPHPPPTTPTPSVVK